MQSTLILLVVFCFVLFFVFWGGGIKHYVIRNSIDTEAEYCNDI